MSDSFEKFILLSGSEPVTTSKFVAEAFGKRHDNVLMKIEAILEQVPDFFINLNFKEIQITTGLGFGRTRQDRAYELTKDGFMLLVMGFTGAKAMAVKVAYISAFNYLLEQHKQLAAQTPTIPSLPNLKNDLEAKDKYLRLSDAYHELSKQALQAAYSVPASQAVQAVLPAPQTAQTSDLPPEDVVFYTEINNRQVATLFHGGTKYYLAKHLSEAAGLRWKTQYRDAGVYFSRIRHFVNGLAACWVSEQSAITWLGEKNPKRVSQPFSLARVLECLGLYTRVSLH